MATLRITRTSEYMNRLRDFGGYVDDIKVGTIGNGDTKDFAVSDGAHKVHMKIDWCYSPDREFNVSGASIAKFNTGAVLDYRWFFAIFIIMPLVRFCFVGEASNALIKIIAALLLIGAFYFFFILRRKNYLSLTEDTTINDYMPYTGNS